MSDQHPVVNQQDQENESSQALFVVGQHIFSLALSVLYQGIVSIRVTGLKDPLNLASILSWQAAMARVMEECLHMSDPRNIFSVLSDKGQSQIGSGEEHWMKSRLAWGCFCSALNPAA